MNDRWWEADPIASAGGTATLPARQDAPSANWWEADPIAPTSAHVQRPPIGANIGGGSQYETIHDPTYGDIPIMPSSNAPRFSFGISKPGGKFETSTPGGNNADEIAHAARVNREMDELVKIAEASQGHPVSTEQFVWLAQFRKDREASELRHVDARYANEANLAKNNPGFHPIDAAARGYYGGGNALYAIVNPEAAVEATHQLAEEYPIQQTTGNRIAEAIGGAAPDLPALALGPAAAPYFVVKGAAAGVGGGRMQAQQLREQGHDVSGAAEATMATGSGLLNAAAGLVPGRIAGRATAGEGASLLGRFARSGGEMLAGNTLTRAGENVLASATIDPNRDPLEGVVEGMPGDIATALLMHGAGEGMGAMARRRPTAPPPRSEPAPTDRPAASTARDGLRSLSGQPDGATAIGGFAGERGIDPFARAPEQAPPPEVFEDSPEVSRIVAEMRERERIQRQTDADAPQLSAVDQGEPITPTSGQRFTYRTDEQVMLPGVDGKLTMRHRVGYQNAERDGRPFGGTIIEERPDGLLRVMDHSGRIMSGVHPNEIRVEQPAPRETPPPTADADARFVEQSPQLDARPASTQLDRARSAIKSRIEQGQPVSRNIIKKFAGEPWADNHLARGPQPTILEASMNDLRRAAEHFDLPSSNKRDVLVSGLRRIEHLARKDGSLAPDASLLDLVPAATTARERVARIATDALERPEQVEAAPTLSTSTGDSVSVSFRSVPPRSVREQLRASGFAFNREARTWDAPASDATREVKFRIEGERHAYLADRAKPARPEAPTDEQAASTEHAPAPAPKRDTRAITFRGQADAMEKQIDAKKNPAIASQNLTRRRIGIAEGMYKEGERLEKIQTAMRNMADAIDAGELPETLKGVTSKAQVEALLRTNYPHPFAHARVMMDLINELKGKPGITEIRESLRGVSDSGRLRPDQVEPVKKLLALATKHGKSSASYNIDVASYDRLARAGIPDEATFVRAREDLQRFIGPQKDNPAQRIRQMETKLVGRDIPGFFPTPKPVAERLVQAADIQPGQTVFEPSAGKGDILDVVKAAHPDAIAKGVEISDELASIARAKGHDVTTGDALATRETADRVVMNPPFENGQDIEHVRRAYELLKPGGKLVSVMSEGPFFRNDKKATEFRNWLHDIGGESEQLPAGSFTGKDAFRQTGTSTRIVTIEKPATVEPRAEQSTRAPVVSAPEGAATATAARTASKKPAGQYSREGLERDVRDAWERDSGENFTDHDNATIERDLPFGAFTFHGEKFPGEIEHLLQGRKHLERLLKLTPDARQAGGEDAMSQLGYDRYLELLEKLSRSKRNELTAAVAFGKKHHDPEVQFKANLLDAIEAHEGKRPPTQQIDPSTLQEGERFTLLGHEFTVEQSEHGYKVARDGEQFGEVPVEALERMPIDKNSREMTDVPDFAADVAQDDAKLSTGTRAAGGASDMFGNPIFDARVGQQERFGFGQDDAAAARARARTYAPDIERKPAPEMDREIVGGKSKLADDMTHTGRMFDADVPRDATAGGDATTAPSGPQLWAQNVIKRKDAARSAAAKRAASIPAARKRYRGDAMDVEEMIAHAIVKGAPLVRQGYRTFSEFAKWMARKLPEATMESLRRIFVYSRRLADMHTEDERAAWINRQLGTKAVDETIKTTIRRNVDRKMTARATTDVEALRGKLRGMAAAANAGWRAGIEAGRAEAVDPIETTRQRVERVTGQSDQSRNVSESRALAGSMRKAEQASRAGYRSAVQEGAAVRSELLRIVRDALPPGERDSMAGQIASAQTLADLNRGAARLRYVLADHDVREAIAAAEKLTGTLTLDPIQGPKPAPLQGTKPTPVVQQRPVDLRTLAEPYRAQVRELIRKASAEKQALKGARSIDEKYQHIDRLEEITNEVREQVAEDHSRRETRIGEKLKQRDDVVAEFLKKIDPQNRAAAVDGKTPDGPPDASIARKWFGRNSLSMQSIAAHIDPEGGDVTGVIIGNIRRAQEGFKGEQHRFSDHIGAALKEAGIAPHSLKLDDFVNKKQLVKLPDAGDVTMTRNNMVGLIASAGDVETAKLIAGSFNSEGEVERASWSFRSNPRATPFTLTPADVAAIREQLTPGELKLITAFKTYNEQKITARLMQAALDLKGHAPDTHAGYFPRARNRAQNPTEGTPEGWRGHFRAAVENISSLKERAPDLKQPIFVPEFIQDAYKYVDDSARVIHLAEPVRTAAMVLEDPRVKAAVEKRFGDSLNKRFDRFLEDTAMVRTRPAKQWYERITGTLSRSISRAWLQANPSPVAKNVFGGTAKLIPEFDARDYLHGVSKMFSREVHRRMLDQSDVAWERYNGGLYGQYSPLTGTHVETVAELGLKDAMIGLAKARSLRDAASKAGQAVDALPFMEWADAVPFHVAFAAAEHFVDRTMPDAAPEVKRRAMLDKFHDAVFATQNGTSSTEISGLGAWAKTNPLAQPFLMFSSDNNKSYNMLARLGSADGATRAKTVLAITLNAMIGSGVAYGMKALAAATGRAIFGSDEDPDDLHARRASAGWDVGKNLVSSLYGGETAFGLIRSILTNGYPDDASPNDRLEQDLMNTTADLGRAIFAYSHAAADSPEEQRRVDAVWKAAGKLAISGQTAAGSPFAPFTVFTQRALKAGSYQKPDARIVHQKIDAAQTKERRAALPGNVQTLLVEHGRLATLPMGKRSEDENARMYELLPLVKLYQNMQKASREGRTADADAFRQDLIDAATSSGGVGSKVHTAR